MVKVMIVGAGSIAKKHVHALQMISNAKIVSVIDVNIEKAEAMAAICNARVYNEIEECVNDVDVAYILTPPSFHRELTLKAITAGKHVVCEKPISISLEDAEMMVEAAKNAKVKLMVAFNMRFRKGFERLKEIAGSGKLGKIINLWIQRIGIGVRSGYNWRTDPKLLCGMSIESLAHDIDLVRWIAGEIIDVSAKIYESNPNLTGFDDNANVILTLGNGSVGIIHASWSSYLSMNSRGVIGSKGTAFAHGQGLWDINSMHWKTTEMENEFIEVINDPLDISSYIRENEHFIDCIERDGLPVVTGEDGLVALRVSHAILDSHKYNKVITI